MINARDHDYYVRDLSDFLPPFQIDLNDFPSPLLTGVATPFAGVNSQRPRFYSSPNVYCFSSFSNCFGLDDAVLVEYSIVVLANVLPYSRSASHGVHDDKTRECFYSVANLNHNAVNDTTFPPTDATTSHRRKRFLLQHRELHRHRFQAPPPASVVLKILYVVAWERAREYAAALESLYEYSEVEENQ